MSRLVRERGTVTVLTVGFLVFLGLLVAVVVDASAAYLRRQSMSGLADGAALAAADGAQGDALYTQGLGEQAPIDPLVAQRAVADYLASTGATASYPGLDWDVAVTGTTVTVRLASPVDLPLDPAGWAGASTVTSTGSAVVQVTASYPGLDWQVTVTGTTVRVHLGAPLDLPLDPAGWAGASTVTSTGSAVVQVE